MPWDLDRFHGKNADLPHKTMFPRLETRPDPYSPSRLFTIPLDILEHLLNQLKKRDAFRLAQTCKTFMWHPVVLKTIFHEPISTKEIASWEGQLPDYMMGPPVTWGINAFTGPLVRRLTFPEWTSEQDIHYLTASCPNLHAVDFTKILKPVAHSVIQDSIPDSDSDEEECDVVLLPLMQDRCPALFKNLRSVHIYYCYGTTPYSRQYDHFQTHIACLPKVLHLAHQLQCLELTCKQEPTLYPSPETRREASAKLLVDILNNVSRGLTTLALYDSESTIENLDSFLQSLAIFPKLRTIKLSLHHDLEMYQRGSLSMYGFHATILSSAKKHYEYDTALQYLSTIKKINDRGRFSLVSSDCGETFHSKLRDYYGLCHTQLVHGSRLWTPVWTWSDRLNWVEGHRNYLDVEIVDIERCRALFEELTKARIPISVELEPPWLGYGAFFAGLWDEGISRLTRALELQPKQHFIQRKLLNSIKSKNPSPYHGMPTGVDDQPIQTVSANTFELATMGDKLGYSDYEDNSGRDPLALAAWVSPKHETPQNKQRENTAKINANPYISPVASETMDANTEIPDPIWRLNEIGDLVDDLRLIWHRGFAYAYTMTFTDYCHPNPDWVEWSKVIHKSKVHLRARLWREAEYTALLFRRLRVDFPRLTRLALYLPAALYPDHDQTFINHVLPGTGWTVKHYGKVGCPPPVECQHEACLKFTDDMCPFIRRIFTRPTPTDIPSAVIVHDDEWHRTKRPLFDLDGEYKSMEQLLTEPLRENYTEGNFWQRTCETPR